MDAALSTILQELHNDGRAFDATKSDRTERLRNLEPDTARVLGVLVRARAAPRVLELGTSNGYSTLWLADAVRGAGGSLVSVDLDAARSGLAADNLERAGLRELVELRVQDAAETLRAAGDGDFEVIFLDSERPAYPAYWPDLRRVLAPGGVLCLDNATSHAGELVEFRALIDAAPDAVDALVPTGAGLLLVAFDRAGPAAR
jgi:predicted O-methyltransferase YrrM